MKTITMLLAAAAVAPTLTACAAATENEETAPAIAADDTLEAQDEGTTYVGWTQSMTASASRQGSYPNWTYLVTINHTLARSSGDAQRGGGACMVYKNSTTCTSDANCSNGAGYCYQGFCYVKTPIGDTGCVRNPDRNPGTISSTFNAVYYYTQGSTYALGCMSKTDYTGSGIPDCSNPDNSKFMRYVIPINLQ